MEGAADGVATDEYEALLAGSSADPRNPEIDENAMAELFYTSGTTGFPKGVAMTHRELHLHGLYAEIGLQFTEDDVVLHVVPLFHVNGWGTPHFLTMVGGQHVMLRKFEPLALMQAVERHRVTRDPGRAGHLQRHPPPRRSDQARPVEPQAADHRRRAVLAHADRGPRGDAQASRPSSATACPRPRRS